MSTSIGPLPSTLINGTPNDATQVMLDLNWIVNQVNSNVFAKSDLNGAAGVGAGNITYVPGTGYSSGTVGYAINNIFGIPYYSTGGDDALAIQTLANANPYRTITNATGGTLNAYTNCVITADGVIIEGNGGSLKQNTVNTNTLTFRPTTAGTTSAYSNFQGVRNLTIDHSSVAAGSTSGNGLEFTQCNGYFADRVKCQDADIVVAGGQNGRMDKLTLFSSNGTTRGAGSALLHIQDAPVGAGWQNPTTLQVDRIFASSSKLRDAPIGIHSGDGITFTGGYANGGANSIFLVNSIRNGSYVGPLTLNGVYIDCVNPSTGTPNGIELRADGNSSSIVYSVIVNGCTIGNGTGVGFLGRKPETQIVNITGGQIINFSQWAVDIQSGTTGNVILNGPALQTNGSAGATGDIRLVGGNSFNLSNVPHTNSKNVCLLIGGTWNSATFSGMNNITGTASDYSASSATFTTPLTFDNCQSRYSGAAANSWLVAKKNIPTYANLAAATAAGLVSGQEFRITGSNTVSIV